MRFFYLQSKIKFVIKYVNIFRCLPIYALKITQLEFQNSAFWKGVTGLEPVWRKTSLKYFVYILAEVLGEGKYLFCFMSIFYS